MDKDNILEKINKAALKFLAPLSPEETYKTIVLEAIKLVKADEGLIILMTKDGLQTIYGSTPAAASVSPRARVGFAYKAYKSKKAFVIHRKNFEKIDPRAVKAGVYSTLFLPLSYRRTSIGVVVMRSRKKNVLFSEKELDILKLYGSFASLAVQKMKLYNEIKDALTTRDLFISLAAHELRTPLTTVHGYIQLLSKRLKDLKLPEAKWTDETVRETKRLTQLINELLEVSRIKTGKLHYNFEETSMKNILSAAVTNFKFNKPHRVLEFTNNINGNPDTIIGDFDKLIQIITNLLDNAAKFSDETQPIRLIVSADKHNYKIIVEDKGIGIEKKDIDLVFNEFYKGTNNTNQQGMGLGLYLAKNIIKKHQGSIRVSSSLGKSTTVEVKLPKAS